MGKSRGKKGGISKKKGFTLVELLIVLAIMSSVIMLGVSSYSVVHKKIKLDIAANSSAGIVSEARDKSRAGHSIGDLPACFGFSVKYGGHVSLLATKYNSAETESEFKCVVDEKMDVTLGNPNPSVIISNIEYLGEAVSVQDEIVVFFRPPHGEIEISGAQEQFPNSAEEPVLRIVLDDTNSDNDLDKREINFNIVTGSVYADKYQGEREESPF